MIQKTFGFLAAVLLLCCAAGPAMAEEGQWQQLPSMISDRAGVGAATGPDGRIYAIGGSSTYGGLMSFMEVYDWKTDKWTGFHGPSLGWFGCVTGPDERIYVIGGSWSAEAMAYDTRTGWWSSLAALPIDTQAEVVHSAAVGNDGRIYVLIERRDFPPYLRAYDIAANTWSAIIHPPVTLPHRGLGLASDAAGRIYVAGGETRGVPSADVFIFDPQANTWESAPPMSRAFSYFRLVIGGDGRFYMADLSSGITMGRDGRIYVLGGEYDSGDGWFSMDRAIAYQPGQAPHVTGVPINVVEGTTFTGVVASFTDSVSTDATEFTAEILWGDGQTSSGIVSANGSGGFDVTASHLYTKSGFYSARTTVQAAAAPGVSRGHVAVADAPLTARGLNIVSSTKSYSGPVATFTDANPYSVASDFTAAIQWGDGTSSSAGTVQAAAGGGYSVSGSHSYRKWGTYAVTVTIQEVGGGTVTAGTTLRVTGTRK